MGNKASKPQSATISAPLPASPIILISTSFEPCPITFPITDTNPPKLKLRLINPTPSPITFRSAFTALDVPLCFSSPSYSHVWSISNGKGSSPNSTQIPIITTERNSAFSGKLFANPDAADLKEDEFITVPPGKQGLTLVFDINIHYGLLPAHEYEFKMRGFDIRVGQWGYGNKMVVVSMLMANIGAESRRDEDILQIRSANPDGAILRVAPSDEQIRFVKDDEAFLEKKPTKGDYFNGLRFPRDQSAAFEVSSRERERLGLPEVHPCGGAGRGKGTHGRQLDGITAWKKKWSVR